MLVTNYENKMNSNYRITIAHAVANENGKANGGRPGDSTGNSSNTTGELRFSTLENQIYNVVLRNQNSRKGDLIGFAAEAAVRNPNIGYSQVARNSGYMEAKLVRWDPFNIKRACDVDCSMLATICANYAGADIPDYAYTGNMRNIYVRQNFSSYISEAFLSNRGLLQVGDILVREEYHCMIVVNLIYHLERTHWKGGYTVEGTKAIQSRLNELLPDRTPLAVDGAFGPKTTERVMEWQEKNDLEEDGQVGALTAISMGMLYK